MKTIKKIGTNKYEVTETREDKYILDIKDIDDNIKGIKERLESIERETKNLKKQKVDQEALKEKLLKIK